MKNVREMHSAMGRGLSKKGVNLRCVLQIISLPVAVREICAVPMILSARLGDSLSWK